MKTSLNVPERTRSVPQMTAEVLAVGDPVAWHLYCTGHRAGVSSERARVQLLAAEFGADLGPSPALQPRLTAALDAGSPEAGRAIRDRAVAAWRALYAEGAVAA